jgi:ribosomal protein bL25 (Ctc-form)
MTKQATLKVKTRDGRGKGAARQLRSAGSIPGNLYGREIEPISVQADMREFSALVGAISVENTIVELSLDGDAPRRVLIREIQRHPVRPDFLHVDFYEIRAGEKLKVNVPLHLIGTPIAVVRDRHFRARDRRFVPHQRRGFRWARDPGRWWTDDLRGRRAESRGRAGGRGRSRGRVWRRRCRTRGHYGAWRRRFRRGQRGLSLQPEPADS